MFCGRIDELNSCRISAPRTKPSSSSLLIETNRMLGNREFLKKFLFGILWRSELMSQFIKLQFRVQLHVPNNF